MNIIELLTQARSSKASDVHLVAASPPVFRIHGALVLVEEIPPLTHEDIHAAFERITSNDNRELFDRTAELDFSFAIPEQGRFRCNAARQLGTTSMVIRILPASIPPIETLGLPSVCRDFISRPRGLIIVSGPTGSGKSTTLASMIDYLNHLPGSSGKRIVTVEDPIEYVYRNHHCLVTQRELGSDTHSFAEALRHVLRQDPDVILIGEMRDTETAAAALTIAETGHLVLTTGHAPSTFGAVERIIDLFPPYERNLVQSRVASLLVAIFCQALVPNIARSGMVAAVEVLLANPAVQNTIREGKIFQIPNIIRTHQQEGMQLLDHALIRLYRDKVISKENMMSFGHNREELERMASQIQVYPDNSFAGSLSVEMKVDSQSS